MCINDRRAFERTMELEKNDYGQWYHTIDLGKETTDGIYDIRPYWKYYNFPDLKGKKVLDVGCADGFFSFEFEKMGAKVTAIDAYKSHFFSEAKKILKSNVEYRIMDVYDLSPERVGYFDFIFCGTVLLHLTDPIKALRNIKSVLKPDGEFICASVVMKKWICRLLRLIGKSSIAGLVRGRPKTGDVPTYWIPTEDCLREMIYKAGFDNIQKVGEFTLRGYSKAAGREEIHPHVVFRMVMKDVHKKN